MLVDTFARYWKHYINVHIYTRPVDGRGSKQYTLYVYTYIYNIIIIIVRATAYLSFVWLCVYMRLVQVRACTVDVTAISWPFILTVFTSTFYAAGVFRPGCVASGNYNGACVSRIIHTVKSRHTYEQAVNDKNGRPMSICAYTRGFCIDRPRLSCLRNTRSSGNLFLVR